MREQSDRTYDEMAQRSRDRQQTPAAERPSKNVAPDVQAEANRLEAIRLAGAITAPVEYAVTYSFSPPRGGSKLGVNPGCLHPTRAAAVAAAAGTQARIVPVQMAPGTDWGIVTVDAEAESCN